MVRIERLKLGVQRRPSPRAEPTWAVAVFGTLSDVLEAIQTFDASTAAALPTIACVPLPKLENLFGPTHSTHSVALDLGQSCPGKRCDYQLHLSRVADAHTGKNWTPFRCMCPLASAYPSFEAKVLVRIL